VGFALGFVFDLVLLIAVTLTSLSSSLLDTAGRATLPWRDRISCATASVNGFLFSLDASVVDAVRPFGVRAGDFALLDVESATVSERARSVRIARSVRDEEVGLPSRLEALGAA